jgi:hypothetical protein
MVTETRRRRTPLVSAALAAAAILILAAPASATPVDVFFDGATMAGDPNNSNFGISEASAFDARDNHDIQLLDSLDFVGPITGVLTANQSLQSYSPDPPVSSLNRATSIWSMDNVVGFDIVGASYVLFTHTDPFTVNGVLIDYADANVGLRIDSDLGWAIVKASEGGVDYYYPAILLDRVAPSPMAGFLADSDTSDSFEVHYVVKEPLVLVDFENDPDEYQLPELEIGFANVVPEPGTALLFGLGLVGLGLGGRRR